MLEQRHVVVSRARGVVPVPRRLPAGRRRQPLPLRLAAQRPARLPLRRGRDRALPRAPLGPAARPHRPARQRARRALERSRRREARREQRAACASAWRRRAALPGAARRRGRLPRQRRHPGRLPRRAGRGHARRARACSAAPSTSSGSRRAPRAACSSVARTLADLAGEAKVGPGAIAAALEFRGDPEGARQAELEGLTASEARSEPKASEGGGAGYARAVTAERGPQFPRRSARPPRSPSARGRSRRAGSDRSPGRRSRDARASGRVRR